MNSEEEQYQEWKKHLMAALQADDHGRIADLCSKVRFYSDAIRRMRE